MRALQRGERDGAMAANRLTAGGADHRCGHAGAHRFHHDARRLGRGQRDQIARLVSVVGGGGRKRSS